MNLEQKTQALIFFFLGRFLFSEQEYIYIYLVEIRYYVRKLNIKINYTYVLYNQCAKRDQIFLYSENLYTNFVLESQTLKFFNILN